MVNIVEIINKVLSYLKSFFFPDQPASWQTFIGLSILSWVTSYLIILPLEDLILRLSPDLNNVFGESSYSSPVVENIISSLGWIFLIIGVWWFTYDDKLKIKQSLSPFGFFIGPWITGAIICAFIFGDWEDHPPSLPFIVWPIISVFIAVLPKFIKPGPAPKTPEPSVRQEVIILVLSNLVLSCWFQLYFSIQNLVVDYPSLMADDFRRSAFVMNLEPQLPSATRGVSILNLAEATLRSELAGQQWSDVERWLIEVDERVQPLEKAVKDQLSPVDENRLWDLEARVFQGNPDYDLRLFAIWRGPSSAPTGYYLTKSCQVAQVRGRAAVVPDPSGLSRTNVTRPSPVAVSDIQCDGVSAPVFDRPDLALQ
jgi:hypothetical protein